MLEKTNLDKCKEVARLFLHCGLKVVNKEFNIISHPFLTYPYIPHENKIINILESKENYNIMIKHFEDIIDKIDDFETFTVFITKPYLLFFLKHTKDYLSIKDFGETLITSWISDENSNNNVNVSRKELLSYFKEVPKEYLMDKEELEVYSNLSDVVEVYRGVTNYNKDNIKVLSWTLDLEKAEWFSHRFGDVGYVYKGKINKKDILTYCNRRKEKEIILDYNKLYDIEELE